MAKIQYKSFESARELRDAVDKAIEGFAQARRRVQVVAVAILEHAAEHGDYTMANHLCHGVNDRSLVLWFQDFGGLLMEPEHDQEGNEKQPDGFNGWQGADHIKEHLETAKETMYWEYRKKPSPFQGMDLETELAKLLKKHQKKVREAQKEAEKEGKGVDEFTREKINRKVSAHTTRQLLDLMDIEGIMVSIEGEDSGPIDQTTDFQEAETGLGEAATG